MVVPLLMYVQKMLKECNLLIPKADYGTYIDLRSVA